MEHSSSAGQRMVAFKNQKRTRVLIKNYEAGVEEYSSSANLAALSQLNSSSREAYLR